MANPFGKDGGPVNNVSRNTFDLSRQNNLTLNFAGIYPCFVEEVLPGDHFKIDTTFGFRFMPTAFPLQTRMRADVHFFYVRDRALYEDWMDLYGMKSYGTNSKECIPPYISPQNARNKDMFGTGGLADYFGVPTTIVGDYGQSLVTPVRFDHAVMMEQVSSGVLPKYYPVFLPSLRLDTPDSVDEELGDEFPFVVPLKAWSGNITYSAGWSQFLGSFYNLTGSVSREIIFTVETPLRSPFVVHPTLAFFDRSDTDHSSNHFFSRGTVLASSGTYQGQVNLADGVSVDVTITPVSDGKWTISLTSFEGVEDIISDFVMAVGIIHVMQSSPTSAVPYSISSDDVTVTFSSQDSVPVYDIIDQPGVRIPWEEKPINAYVFRAYEMIYNSFYRDERNNPYVLNGEVQYNKFLPTTAGGEDTNIYKLHYRNWEQDFLTTAVPTPQMGPAPLVGISALGEMSIQDPESGQVYKVMAQTADDNDTIVGMNVTETLPNTVMRSLVNYATSGISINDFRNVNAFQRWLETNIRKGFKYKDQIKAHYDVDIRFDELNMPEFIGGASIDVTPTTITQTSQDSENNPLGSYAGQLYGSGSSKHPVTQYCDEHGFIIGLVSVVPVPNYSQLMPKHFWKKDSLDYFTPEFGHIGLQPIPAREVCPNQMMQDPNADIEKDIFGYQRAHYDYMQRVDEVHGQFRNTLRNFVMNRVFDSKPVLGPDFTVMSPDHLNDVFTVQYFTDPDTGEKVFVDKILGQMYFSVSAKRPIPRYGVPRLE